MTIEIISKGVHKTGVVTTRKGYVYACTYGESDRVIDEGAVKQDWKEDRRAFQPFNESTGVYC